MKYKLFSDLRTGQLCGVYGFDDNGKASAIPFDEDNTDYQAYLAWLAAGNQPISANAEEGNAPIGADEPISVEEPSQ